MRLAPSPRSWQPVSAADSRPLTAMKTSWDKYRALCGKCLGAFAFVVVIFGAVQPANGGVAVPKRGMVSITMALVGDPGNPSVGVIQTFGGPKGQFVDPPANKGSTGIYKSCTDAPAAPPSCLTVGQVNYKYGIGEFDVTVSQYVTFLNTVDPRGKNLHQLYNDDMDPTVWPKYGSVRYSPEAGAGQHYSVAYSTVGKQALQLCRFSASRPICNSLTNGKVLSTTTFSSGAYNYVTYKVRLSTRTETGMYRLSNPATTRNRSSGFVLPSKTNG